MRRKVAEFCCAGFLAVALGIAIADNGDRDLGAWDVCLLIVGLTALSYWLFAGRFGSAPPLEPRLRWVSFLLLAYVALQLVPLPLFLLRVLSPARAQLVDMLVSVTPAARFAALSVAASITSAYFIRILGYTVVFLLVRDLTCRLRGPWRWALVVPLVAIAASEAAFGLSQISPKETAHGTYDNRNHFAGLLEMILPGAVALGLAIRGLAGIGVLSGAVLIFLGIFYSNSKMGLVAALGGLFIMGVVGLGPRLRPRNRWLAIGGLATLLLATLVFLPPDQVINGIGGVFADESTGEGRFPIWRDSLRMIAAYPIFGVGLGNYGGPFVKYQTALLDLTWNYAHNDYVQLLAELGTLGFLLLGGFVLLVFKKAASAATRSSSTDSRYLGLGCVGGMAAIGLHSLTDYNMYIPANALVFAWIAGIAVGLRPASELATRTELPAERIQFRKVALVLGVALALYASARLVFVHRYLNSPKVETWFCRFGICNMNGYLSSIDPDTIPEAYLLEALNRFPASSDRWDALGKAMWRSGKIEEARLCFSNAIAAGPNRIGTLFVNANFYHSLGEDGKALELTSRALENAVMYDQDFFKWFKDNKIAVGKVVAHGLPRDARVFQNYLRYQLNSKDAAAAEQVWNAMIAHGYADEKSAREYVNFLTGQKPSEDAARAWAAYLGDRRNGYLESNWLLNGDFESEPSNALFDWEASSSDGIEVARDAEVRHTGAYSLRIRFEGKQNPTDAHVGQRAFVSPGRYRFEAYLKSQELTTDQGISVGVFDGAAPSRLDIRTEPLLGTHDWTRVSLSFCVVHPTSVLQVRVVRQPSLKFDNLLKGTLWIDSVSLARLGQNCLGVSH